MLKLTLDTNCLIDLAEGHLRGKDVLALQNASCEGRASIAVAASCASERQRGGTFLASFDTFQARLLEIGLTEVAVLPTIMYWHASYWGQAIFPSESQQSREVEIFGTLFPTVAPHWPKYAKDLGIDPNDFQCAEAIKWRNCLCDVQAFWAHDDANRDVFVTSDGNFRRKLLNSPSFKTAVIKTPAETIQMLTKGQLR